MSKLFVYGSLKEGYPLHGIIGRQEFLGVYKTEPRFKLVTLGPFPAVIPARSDGVEVTGEVYEVDDDTIAYLDVVERVSQGLYNRLRLPVHDQLGTVIKAWVYVSLNAGNFAFEEIKSGVWI
jgi:gamma-glutamylcyclotransferase (GGCT)/AIG2-like uncharacterized protein YtfP